MSSNRSKLDYNFRSENQSNNRLKACAFLFLENGVTIIFFLIREILSQWFGLESAPKVHFYCSQCFRNLPLLSVFFWFCLYSLYFEQQPTTVKGFTWLSQTLINIMDDRVLSRLSDFDQHYGWPCFVPSLRLWSTLWMTVFCPVSQTLINIMNDRVLSRLSDFDQHYGWPCFVPSLRLWSTLWMTVFCPVSQTLINIMDDRVLSRLSDFDQHYGWPCFVPFNLSLD